MWQVVKKSPVGDSRWIRRQPTTATAILNNMAVAVGASPAPIWCPLARFAATRSQCSNPATDFLIAFGFYQRKEPLLRVAAGARQSSYIDRLFLD